MTDPATPLEQARKAVAATRRMQHSRDSSGVVMGEIAVAQAIIALVEEVRAFREDVNRLAKEE